MRLREVRPGRRQPLHRLQEIRRQLLAIVPARQRQHAVDADAVDENLRLREGAALAQPGEQRAVVVDGRLWTDPTNDANDTHTLCSHDQM
jgi:hypothetical protein